MREVATWFILLAVWKRDREQKTRVDEALLALRAREAQSVGHDVEYDVLLQNAVEHICARAARVEGNVLSGVDAASEWYHALAQVIRVLRINV